MTWTVLGPSRDFSGPVEYVMQDGWFPDVIRNQKIGTSYYLFSPNGSTTFAEGTPGFTAASNLPEPFFSSEMGEAGEPFLDRPLTRKGDSISLTLNEDSATLEGIPDHQVTGKSAGVQTLSGEIEAVYWEGSYFDDTFEISINSPSTSIRSIFYWGETGNDVVKISGAFNALDGRHKYADLQPSHVGNAFAGGEGFNRLVINANSYEGFYVSYTLNTDGLVGVAKDLSTRFEIVHASGGNYRAVDV